MAHRGENFVFAIAQIISERRCVLSHGRVALGSTERRTWSEECPPARRLLDSPHYWGGVWGVVVREESRWRCLSPIGTSRRGHHRSSVVRGI